MHNFPWLDFPLLVTDFPSWGSTKQNAPSHPPRRDRSQYVTIFRVPCGPNPWKSVAEQYIPVKHFWDCHVKCLIVFTAKRKSWSTGWSYNLLMKSNKSSWLGNKGVIIGRQHICFFAINHLEPLSVKDVKPWLFENHWPVQSMRVPRAILQWPRDRDRCDRNEWTLPVASARPGWMKPRRKAEHLGGFETIDKTVLWICIYIYIIYLIYWLIDLFIDLFHFSFMYWSIYSCTFLIYWLFSFI